MKRAALLRRVPFRSKPPVWIKPERVRKPICALVRTPAPFTLTFNPVPKRDEPLRSESYRRFVASFGCFRCGIETFSQAAHPDADRGLGEKASDDLCFPLCCTRPGIPGCHFEHDQLIGMTLDERREREKTYTARMQAIARAARRPEFPPP